MIIFEISLDNSNNCCTFAAKLKNYAESDKETDELVLQQECTALLVYLVDGLSLVGGWRYSDLLDFYLSSGNSYEIRPVNVVADAFCVCPA